MLAVQPLNHTIIRQSAEGYQRQRLDEDCQRESIHGKAGRIDLQAQDRHHTLATRILRAISG